MAEPFRPSCSVVICTRRRPEALRACLEAVSRLEYPEFEVIVVDNSGGDEATRQVAEQRNARYVSEGVVGLSRARNRGAAEAKNDIVAYLDDDASPQVGWLSALASHFRDPNVMAVTGRTLTPIVNTNGSKPPAGQFFELGGREQRVVDRTTPRWFSIANFGGLGNGMNMAFRRQAWEHWPGFDERLGRGVALDGGEEHYSFFSLIERGYKVAYTPRAVVVHPLGDRAPAEVRARFLKDCVTAGGYLTFLFFEQPQHRGEVLHFAGEWLLGTPRPWREDSQAQWRIAPAWRVLLARLRGPLLYVQSRFSRDHR